MKEIIEKLYTLRDRGYHQAEFFVNVFVALDAQNKLVYFDRNLNLLETPNIKAELIDERTYLITLKDDYICTYTIN